MVSLSLRGGNIAASRKLRAAVTGSGRFAASRRLLGDAPLTVTPRAFPLPGARS